MKTKKENSLPKMLRGTVHQQFVRCGKKNCKCSRGELHGPYYYHFARISGRLQKRYIKPEELEQFQLACITRQAKQNEMREEAREPERLLREIKSDLRDLQERMKEAGVI
ncbi:MAG TPA: DUF6788 family protein [Pyrinomonadaceae bacterium]|jgi:hypothetical protein